LIIWEKIAPEGKKKNCNDPSIALQLLDKIYLPKGTKGKMLGKKKIFFELILEAGADIPHTAR